MNRRNILFLITFLLIQPSSKAGNEPVTEHTFTGVEAYSTRLAGHLITCWRKPDDSTQCTRDGKHFEQKSLFYCLKDLAQHQAQQREQEEKEVEKIAAFMERGMH